MVFIVKANGQRQEFSLEKVRRSCLRAGASPTLAQEISRKISHQVRNGMTTLEIRRLIFRYLNKEEPKTASLYSLKEAIFRLGPQGFYFEKIVAEIFQREGYQVEIDKIFSGACVEHEIDITAKKEQEKLMIECKFHHQPGLYTELKDVLYVWARFLDLKEGGCDFTQPVLVSNTKFSESVKKYALCKNFPLIGWSYPEEKNLQYFIEKYQLYPITVLRRLEKYYQEKLLRYGIVSCQDLLKIEPRKLQRETGLDVKKINILRSEVLSLIR
ncbi:MAG: ATP cone domain-containing protein [Patescibacteria group bacterium]|nr:ATP cone domain-containing protein [Patescibacteria group bacterium]